MCAVKRQIVVVVVVLVRRPWPGLKNKNEGSQRPPRDPPRTHQRLTTETPASDSPVTRQQPVQICSTLRADWHKDYLVFLSGWIKCAVFSSALRTDETKTNFVLRALHRLVHHICFKTLFFSTQIDFAFCLARFERTCPPISQPFSPLLSASAGSVGIFWFQGISHTIIS